MAGDVGGGVENSVLDLEDIRPQRVGYQDHLIQGGQAGFGNNAVDEDDGAGGTPAVPGSYQGLDAGAGFFEGPLLAANGVMDFLRAVHRDRHYLDVLGHQVVGHPVQQGAVGLEVDHEAPALGLGQQGGEMRVKGGFPAGEVKPRPEGRHLIQEADPGGQGEFPARVVPGEPGGVGGMTVLLAHAAFQIAAPGEVEVEVRRGAA